MLDNLDKILREQCGLEKGKQVLAGVSGGPDSLCLLSSLHEAGWQVIAAHFNHQLRPEAAAEAAAVEAIAAQMGVPFIGGAGDVRAYAEQHRLSIETAARELRYRFLFEQARRYKAQAVAVGHTADDQVETVLMHFLRGAGLNGLKGMPYRTVLKDFDAGIPLVRPLLDTWRAETVSYCQQRRLEPHYDASNESTDFLRNRLRHELIPALETYNPRFREAVWRTGKTLSSDHELLSNLLQPIWESAKMRQADAYLELDLKYVTAQPRGVQMHILQRTAQALLPNCDVGFDDLQRVTALVADPAQERGDFTGGLVLFKEGSRLCAARSENDVPRDQWPQMPEGAEAIRVTVPCNVTLDSGWTFSATSNGALPESWKDANPFEAWIDPSSLPQQLELRVRRDGDRFEPLGMDGHSQKLSDFFVNSKMPARARDHWPLLCAGNRVIWVPGFRPADAVRVHAETKAILQLAVLPPTAATG